MSADPGPRLGLPEVFQLGLVPASPRPRAAVSAMGLCVSVSQQTGHRSPTLCQGDGCEAGLGGRAKRLQQGPSQALSFQPRHPPPSWVDHGTQGPVGLSVDFWDRAQRG